MVDDVTTPILNTLRTTQLPVKIWVPNDDNGYRVKNRTRDIDEITSKNTQQYHDCYRWDIGTPSTTLENDGLNHMLARIVGYGTDFVCVDNRTHPCEQLVLFHDCHYDSEYPETFYKVKAFNNFDILKKFIDNIPDEFSLDDTSRFMRTNYVVQGQTVHREMASGRYWYLDNMHEDHHEVFDYKGDHLGEADLNGNLNVKKRDPKKKLNLKKMGHH